MATYDTWGGSWGTSWALSWTVDRATATTPTGGKGDNPSGTARQRRIFKPTGLLERNPVKAKQRLEDVEIPRTEDGAPRLDDVALKAELQLPSLPSTSTLSLPELIAPVALSASEIDAEIGRLLRIKLRTDEEETIMLLLMAAST